MKLKPQYPKQILERSYNNGIIIGSMIGLGIGIMLLSSLWLGVSMFVLGVLLYHLQND